MPEAFFDLETDRPVWLLDIDGVLNANKPGWSAAPRRTTCMGFTIRWAPALVSRIQRLKRSGSVDIYWSTTWCGFPDQLRTLELQLGLVLPQAFGERNPSLTWSEMKANASLDVVAAGRPLIWTDDDEVGISRHWFPQLAEAERNGEAILIQPRSNRGLQPEDLDAIDEFVLKHNEGIDW